MLRVKNILIKGRILKKLLLVGFILAAINCYGMDKDETPDASKELFSAEEYNVHCAARRLADLVFLAAMKINENPEYPFTVNYLDDRRKESVQSCNRAKQGLFLEFYYGYPASIHTPLGKWGFNGSASMPPRVGFKPQESRAIISQEQIHEIELAKLGVEMVVDIPGKQEKRLGYYGPIYRIDKIEDFNLPAAISNLDVFDIDFRSSIEHRSSREQSVINAERKSWYEARDVRHNKWVAMTEQYESSKK